jgi:phage/plasmid-like protein (TIGR03299 family)
MAHLLENNTMAFNGKNGLPWHGLGNDIRADIESGMTVVQMLKKYGYDTVVALRPLFFNAPHELTGFVSESHVAEDQFAVVRTSDNKFMGVSGKNWKPVQNETVAQFFDDYCSLGGATIDTFGSLREGQTFWMQADLGDKFVLPGGDVVKGRLLASNRHKPGETMRIAVVQERVVCANTLRIAEGEKNAMCVKHHHGRIFDDKAKALVQKQIGLQRKAFNDYANVARQLCEVKMNDEKALDVIIQLMGDETSGRDSQPRTVGQVMGLYNGSGIGADLVSSKGTAWGLLNAVTEFVDHHAGHKRDTALTAAWFGTGASLKNEALDLVKQLIVV